MEDNCILRVMVRLLVGTRVAENRRGEGKGREGKGRKSELTWSWNLLQETVTESLPCVMSRSPS
jgi:hypothetical protein